MTVRIARGLFRVAALLYAAAGVIVAPAKGARAPVPINTHSFPRYQSLTAFGSPPQAVYFVCFSPAFIFDNLSRGPPAHLKGHFSGKRECTRETLFTFVRLT